MPVPEGDTLCRFVRAKDWSRRDNRPKPGAFKQHRLSVWHTSILDQNGVTFPTFASEASKGPARRFTPPATTCGLQLKHLP